MKRACLLFAATVWLTTQLAAAADSAALQNWPHWRGPLDNGVSPSADPPTTWSETSNIKWNAKIPGLGSAAPVIWDNQIFIQTAVNTGRKAETSSEKSPAPPSPQMQPGQRRGGGGMPMSDTPTEFYQFDLICIDRQTGKTLWQKIAREEVPHEGFRPGDGTFASSSPVTDGKHVYAYFGSRGLYCYDMQGNLKWSKDFGKMKVRMAFGEGSSPALFGNTLAIAWDQDTDGGSFIAALDAGTGRELWRKSRAEKTSWATPLILEHDGKAQVITDASAKIRSYDLANGDVIWQCGGLSQNVIPCPVADNDMVYSMSGFQGNALLAIKLGRTGDLTGTDAIAWKYGKATPYVPSPLLYGDRLYFLAGNNGRLSCADAKTGKILIESERLEAIPNVYASPVGAAGRIYLAGREGTTVVIKNSTTLEILATNKLDDGFDASPAVVGKELYLRGQEYLYCIAGK